MRIENVIQFVGNSQNKLNARHFNENFLLLLCFNVSIKMLYLSKLHGIKWLLNKCLFMELLMSFDYLIVIESNIVTVGESNQMSFRVCSSYLELMRHSM